MDALRRLLAAIRTSGMVISPAETLRRNFAGIRRENLSQKSRQVGFRKVRNL